MTRERAQTRVTAPAGAIAIKQISIMLDFLDPGSPEHWQIWIIRFQDTLNELT